MSKQTVPIKKEHLDNAIAEIEELNTAIEEKTRRRDELRYKMADLFHDGEDGTKNVELHGWEVKVVRKLNLSCDAESKQQLEADHPSLFKKLFKKKTTLEFQKTVAIENRKEIDRYLTSKQGLPVVSFKRIEEDK